MMSSVRDRRLLASMQELMGSLGALILLSLIVLASNAIDCAQVSSSSTSNNQSVTSSSSSRPYWHKPGCHQVGHTRTISIPGCVKFNLSTNACRGFCMSFSIPATDDIGPAPPAAGHLDHLDGLVATGGGGGGGEPTAGTTTPTASTPPMTETAAAGATMDTQQLASIISGQVDGQEQQQPPLIITRRLAARNARDSAQSNRKQDEAKKTSGLQMSEFLHLAGQTKSPLAGAVGDLSDRRDVISVGQCCNMMETEDVTINLRCGLNETRKLVFKSAKTCECFFCKHL